MKENGFYLLYGKKSRIAKSVKDIFGNFLFFWYAWIIIILNTKVRLSNLHERNRMEKRIKGKSAKKYLYVLCVLVLVMAALFVWNWKTAEEEKDARCVPRVSDGAYLYEALGAAQLLSSGKEDVREVTAVIDQEGNKNKVTLTRPKEIRKALEAFRNIRVLRETDIVSTDCYNYVKFEFGNQESLTISLNGNNLEQSEEDGLHYYELEGIKAFWGTVFDLKNEGKI